MATLPSFVISDQQRQPHRAVVVGKLVQIDTIKIDACREENHNFTNTVTDHPVEEGTNISDHSRPEPDQVSLTCFISNTPLSSKQQDIANEQAATSPGLQNANGTTKIQALPTRGSRVFDALNTLRIQGTLISVVTTLKTYGVSSTEGMLITALSVPRNAKNFDGLEFSITLKQIRIVRNRSTRAPAPKDPRTGAKQSKGNQTPKQEELESNLSKSELAGGRGELPGKINQ